jgi:hypothetical protein
MKHNSTSRRWHDITNPEAARVMNNPMVFRMLSPFLGRENTVGGAAKLIGISNVKMFRQVKRFLELGLLKITRLETRAGKPIKHYRTVAPGFFVPHTLLASETLEVEFLAQNSFWEHILARAIGATSRDAMRNAGSYFFRNDQGDLRKVTGHIGGLNTLPENVSPNPSQTPVWSDWSVMMLEPEDARALYEDMANLFKRYKLLHQRHLGRPYLMRTAMAPLCEDDANVLPMLR